MTGTLRSLGDWLADQVAEVQTRSDFIRSVTAL